MEFSFSLVLMFGRRENETWIGGYSENGIMEGGRKIQRHAFI
jgi:hypothetical protein